MDYADQTLELLLLQYHQSDDIQAINEIAQVVMSRKISIDDMATINNAFYYFMKLHKRSELRNWALSLLTEDAIVTETHDLLGLYEVIGGQGVIAYFINHHLRERMVTNKHWLSIITKFEHITSPLTSYGAQFILQHSVDPYLLADIHFLSSAKSKIRERLTKKIIAMNGHLSYTDWEEIATRCAYPSKLWSYATDELDEFYYAEEADLPQDPDPRKKS